ncbi:N-acetyltransferase [Paenibacillus piri]|uniref:N-acetyltransferase n=1 Tax=Paenibacillus piri TaxID=2547395 RepID=A0A4V2ZU75_9BACL|nr:N-acetyltransferase [Paenibacillus piri]
MDVEIKKVQPNDPDLLRLIAKLDEELLERYPAEEVHGVDVTDPRVREIVFIIAYAGRDAAGCGAIRPLDSKSTELKRFFVDRDYRKQGIAGRMLAFLEGQAKEQCFETIKLEAGPGQPEALRFYEKHGYREIDKFGEYAACELSICYEKRIG